MEELVYRGSEGQGLTDSLRVAMKFEKEHRNVIRDIDNLKKDMLNFEQMFVESTYLDSYNRPQRMYIMNRDGFSLLTMGFTGTKALNFKVEFINDFNKMEEKLRELSNFKLPQTYAEALRLAADQAEQIDRQQLQISEQAEQIGIQKLQAAKDAPLVLFSKSVETSKDSCLIRELAKILKQNGYNTGEKRLFEKLRNEGYLCKNNEPTQKSMNLKLFEVIKRSIYESNGKTRIESTTKVTGKGQIYFVDKFLKKQRPNDLFNNYN